MSPVWMTTFAFLSQLFDRLKGENPSFADKVLAIAGDMQNDDLGLNDADRALLANCVHVVFHCAATIRFDEPLR